MILRFAQGLLNSNIGIARACIGELCTRTALAAVADEHERGTA